MPQTPFCDNYTMNVAPPLPTNSIDDTQSTACTDATLPVTMLPIPCTVQPHSEPYIEFATTTSHSPSPSTLSNSSLNEQICSPTHKRARTDLDQLREPTIDSIPPSPPHRPATRSTRIQRTCTPYVADDVTPPVQRTYPPKATRILQLTAEMNPEDTISTVATVTWMHANGPLEVPWAESPDDSHTTFLLCYAADRSSFHPVWFEAHPLVNDGSRMNCIAAPYAMTRAAPLTVNVFLLPITHPASMNGCAIAQRRCFHPVSKQGRSIDNATVQLLAAEPDNETPTLRRLSMQINGDPEWVPRNAPIPARGGR